MCIRRKGVLQLENLFERLDDQELRQLAWVYMRRERTTADQHLRNIIGGEILHRRNEKVSKLNRDLWLSTRRGKVVEAIKRRLVRWGVWSSSKSREEKTSNLFFSLVKAFFTGS
ncbi:hypothetical protein [Prochlorococcus sp. MIT 1341]|uniref:hypothetical protein n=1 Tax=Prochlorococcus sp. MIT 1341 TaxID=3096221 RepID=UPI002A75EC3A|nr:hypothetical protein [Prochlorococcus sp. MIT 1341]